MGKSSNDDIFGDAAGQSPVAEVNDSERHAHKKRRTIALSSERPCVKNALALIVIDVTRIHFSAVVLRARNRGILCVEVADQVILERSLKRVYADDAKLPSRSNQFVIWHGGFAYFTIVTCLTTKVF